MRTKKVETEVSQEMKLWKENKIDECRMEFSCGGDSMNEYDFKFYDKKGKEIVCDELEDYFDNEVFNRVEFYECSDGHYMGEFGEVVITLNEEEDDFEYDKRSKSEWCEPMYDTIDIKLSSDMLNFIKEKVSNLNGGDFEVNVNYKKDFVLTDKEEDKIDKLLVQINKKAYDFEFENQEGEPDELVRWSTSEQFDEDDNIEIKENVMTIHISRQFVITKEE